MGTPFINTAEGQADGGTLPTGSASSGLAYDAATISAGTTAKWSAAAAIRGGTGMEFVRTSSAVVYIARAASMIDSNSAERLFAIRFPTLPTGTGVFVVIHGLRNAANQQAGALCIDNAGHFFVAAGGAGTPSVAVSGSTLAFVLTSGQAVYVGYRIDAIAGTFWIGVYDASTGGLIEEKSGTGSFGGAQLTNERLGFQSVGNNWLGAMHIDDDAGEDSPSAHLAVPGVTAALTVRPTSTISNTDGWTVVGGASVHAVLADESDASYIRSADAPSADVVEWKFAPLDAGPISVPLRHSATTSNQSIEYRLYQGTTLKASRTINPVPLDWTNYDFVLTTPENASVTDRTDLRIRAIATQV